MFFVCASRINEQLFICKNCYELIAHMHNSLELACCLPAPQFNIHSGTCLESEIAISHLYQKTSKHPLCHHMHNLRVVSQGFLAEGLQRTTAGLGSVIIDSQPLTVALLATLFLGERFTRGTVLGLLLGTTGLCLLELPRETVLTLPQQLAGVCGGHTS